MSQPGRFEYWAQSNEDFSETLTITDLIAGGPLDLTGCTLEMQFRQPGDTPAAPSLNLANVAAGPGVSIYGISTSGVVAIMITRATLGAVANAAGYVDLFGDLKVTNAAGTVLVPARGVIHLTAGISQ